MNRTIFALTLTTLSLSGCGVQFGGDAESSGSGESGGTLGNSSAPTAADPTEDGTTAATTGLPNTPEDGTTAVTTGLPDGTTGDVSITATEGDDDGATVTTIDPGGFTTGVVEPSLCEGMCEHAVECRIASDAATCATLCEEQFEGADQACEQAGATMLLCFAELGCEHLALALAGELNHPCNGEQIEKQQICHGPPNCDFGAGGDFEGKACFVEILCPGDPVRKMECDTEQCLCIVDGEQVGSCAAEAVCDDINSTDDKSVECCGFPQVEL